MFLLLHLFRFKSKVSKMEQKPQACGTIQPSVLCKTAEPCTTKSKEKKTGKMLV